MPVPHARTLEDAASFTTAPGQPDDGGDARRRARKEHTARQAERARQRREDDRRDSGDGRARAPRATDFGQRPKDAGGCAPAPAKITGRVRPPEGGSTKRGRGERPAGAAGEGERPDAKPSAAPRPTANQTPEQPPTTAPGGAPRARKRAGSRTTARRGDAKQSAASGQAAQADDGETASGRGSRPTPPHATARREPRQRTAKRRRDGRRRRRPGAETGRESQAAAPRPPAQKNAGTERHSTRATDAEAANHGGHGRQHARTPGGGTLRERADGQRVESATGQRQTGGRARESPDKAAEGSGRSGGAPTAQPNAESDANAESRPPDRGPPLRPL